MGVLRKVGEKNLKGFSRSLRKNMTKEERHLWYDFLKEFPVMVHRQKVIGSYIVDFYIAEKKLVIELDGSQHYSEEGKAYDAERDAFLNAQGLTVLRYANSDVNTQFEAVCRDIWNHAFLDDPQ
ncbi:MAG: endonuclease domain-containing protein [Candidatus Faecousia sp.]|nr:endonuclease domain-containing protein [Candidatus Faecousia sp.]